jgi:hypothetical protein
MSYGAVVKSKIFPVLSLSSVRKTESQCWKESSTTRICIWLLCVIHGDSGWSHQRITELSSCLLVVPWFPSTHDELHLWNFSRPVTFKYLKMCSEMCQMRCLLLKFWPLFPLYTGPTGTYGVDSIPNEVWSRWEVLGTTTWPCSFYANNSGLLVTETVLLNYLVWD